MRIGKNELEILDYLREKGHWNPKYNDIRRQIGLDDYTDNYVRERSRIRCADPDWSDMDWGSIYKHIESVYKRATLTNRAVFSQAINRLIKKGLVETLWEFEVHGTDVVRKLGEDAISYTKEKPDFYLKKLYTITDAGRTELYKRRRRLE